MIGKHNRTIHKEHGGTINYLQRTIYKISSHMGAQPQRPGHLGTEHIDEVITDALYTENLIIQHSHI